MRLLPARPIFSPERTDTIPDDWFKVDRDRIGAKFEGQVEWGDWSDWIACVLHRLSTGVPNAAVRQMRLQKPCVGNGLWRRIRSIAVASIHKPNASVDGA